MTNNINNNPMQEMMNQMMGKMMEACMTSMMNNMMQAMGTMFQAPTEVAEAPAKQESTVRRLTIDDLEEEVTVAESNKAELGLWEGISKNGKPYQFFGWANPETGKSVFPGKQLYYINDFYLKRDYGAYHPGKTTNYKFKNNGLRAALMNYSVRTEVASKDAKQFQEYMAEKQEKKRQVNLTDDIWSNWIG